MIRLFIGLLVALAVFTVYTVVDCALSDRGAVRAIPKWAWVLIVLVLPIIGAGLWFAIGRPRRSTKPERRFSAPDDDPDFLGTLGRGRGPATDHGHDHGLDREQEERIARLERDLSDLDDPGEADGTGRRDA